MGTALKLLKNNKNYKGLLSGTYYTRKRKKGLSFKLYYISQKNGKRLPDEPIPELAYPELGFKPDWTWEEARNRCSDLNSEKKLEHGKVRLASQRLQKLKSIDKILFNPKLVNSFAKRLEDENEGTDQHLKKLGSHFLKMQKLCKDLRLLPKDYKDNEKLIYKWFAENKVSLDYTQKLISLLNRWGYFSSKSNGQLYEAIRPVKGISRQKIKDSHILAEGVRKESKPLDPELLKIKKNKLSDENYNFLYLTVWFGLRPSEVATLVKSEIKTNAEGTQFLMVYQSKLNMIEKEKRYKAIPILFSEQKVALNIIESKQFKAPIYKTMRNIFGANYGLYSGRKGFTDLMLSNGYAIEDISLWLGHTSIETTWTHYKNKNVLSLPSPKKNRIV